MMTMSKPKTAGGARAYFKDEYEHARGSYYTEEERVIGCWNGELAAELGLRESVTEEQFTRLANGRDPHDGRQLVRQVKAHEREGRNGEVKKTLGHRAGVDITFSAPKSVTLACIVGGDERLRELHRAANKAAMGEVEKNLQARLGGKHAAETTGKAIIATFEHDAARPDRKANYAAPDLHSHNFVFNVARTADGKSKSVDMAELYRAQKKGTAVYRAELAAGLQRLGYEIRLDERTGAPEIAGISREYIEASSPRQSEIKETAERMRAEGKQLGMVREDGSTSTRAAATVKRRTKVFDRDEMKARHQEIELEYGGQAKRAAETARVRERVLDQSLLYNGRDSRTAAREAVTYAVALTSERETVNTRDALLTHALVRGLGRTTFEAVQAEITGRHERGELIELEKQDAVRRRVIAEKMIATERANIETMRAGQGLHPPIIHDVSSELATAQGVTLNDNQQRAVKEILESRDRVQGLQGGAGTGKTTVLSAIKTEAGRAGYVVEGYAPTTRAAQVLRECGIEAQTLQRFIRSKQELDAGKRLLILDESSLASTRQMNAFLSKANPHDRILLVGDVRQHEGIEAGSPFAQLQQHGMQTARLEKIVRQREEPLRRVVERLAVGQVKAAVDYLQKQNRITEIKDDKTRLEAIAEEYARQPDGTLVISPRNSEREELNRLVHDARRNDNQIGKDEHPTRILRNRNELTGAERTFAGAYRQGDIIRFNTNSKIFGVKAGEYARVETVNQTANLLTIEFAKDAGARSGRRMNYDPKRLQGVSVYREAKIKVSEGERVQFRAPASRQRISNGELGTIERIEKDKWTIVLDTNRRVVVSPKENPHLDYGYAVTSHSSQGQTVNRVLVNMDTRESDVLLNRRMAYVALSRMRADVRIYTDSTGKLSAALARQVDKSTALEAAKRLSHEHSPNKEHPSDKEQTHEQRATPSTLSADRTGESREEVAGRETATEPTIIHLTYHAFDRERIHRIAKRAVRDDKGVSAVEGRVEGRVEERADRVGSSEGRSASVNQRVAVRGDASEREDFAARAESRAIASGHERVNPHRRGTGVETEQTGEPSHATKRATSESRERAQAEAHPSADAVFTLPTQAGDIAGELGRTTRPRDSAGDTSNRSGESRARDNSISIAGTELLRHRTEAEDARIKRDGDDRDVAQNHRRRLDSDSGDFVHRSGSLRDHLAGDGDKTLDRRQSDHHFNPSNNVRIHDTDNRTVEVNQRSIYQTDNRLDDNWTDDGRLDKGQGLHSGAARTDGLLRFGITTPQSPDVVEPPRIADEVRAIFERDGQIERMADEFVRIANENRMTQGRAEMSEQVQDAMHEVLMNAAERPPSPAQVERDGQIAQQHNHEEPQHKNALESSLYAARYAANRHKLVEQFTANIEAAYEPQREPERTIEHQRERDDFTLSR
ncbi:MAG: relaxase domain-containing protein [Pyrinomonadaceae bacterium MAG19_C2-C3]|nr:relaxase domain-containing protein [Pyrinomonadaceae bacterium MAG19_C2-C3]